MVNAVRLVAQVLLGVALLEMALGWRARPSTPLRAGDVLPAMAGRDGSVENPQCEVGNVLRKTGGA